MVAASVTISITMDTIKLLWKITMEILHPIKLLWESRLEFGARGGHVSHDFEVVAVLWPRSVTPLSRRPHLYGYHQITMDTIKLLWKITMDRG